MKIADLDAEFAAAQNALVASETDQLVVAGVPHRFVKLGMIGTARIALRRGRSVYDPDEAGITAFVLPVRVDSADTPESPEPSLAIDYGDIVDLCVFHPSTPSSWATRCDAATWLGAIEPQYLSPEPVPISRSPLTWLRGGRRGICVLTREPREAQSLLLRCRGGFEAEDAEHGRELRRLIERPFPIPPVFVASAKRRRAA